MAPCNISKLHVTKKWYRSNKPLTNDKHVYKLVRTNKDQYCGSLHVYDITSVMGFLNEFMKRYTDVHSFPSKLVSMITKQLKWFVCYAAKWYFALEY